MYEDHEIDNISERQVMSPIPVVNQKNKKSPSLFGKLMTSLCMGLLFGLFAGFGFFVVCKYTNLLPPAPAQGIESQASASAEPPFDPSVQPIIKDTKEEPLPTPAAIVNTTTDISKTVSRVMPSMVSIVESHMQTYDPFDWGGFSYFFGGSGESYSQEVSGSGSGIIIGETDTEYLIVTNNHVVQDAESLEVTLADGTITNANIKGTNSQMDLAVIAIQKGALASETRNAIAVATLGDSDRLNLGEPVIAIGNALGYGQSVTYGIVSALNREVTTEDGHTNLFIQTDAAINPGNSGGALLDLNGQVIGINSNKIGGSTVEGMGYAIPISAAKEIIANLSVKSTKIKVAEEDMGYIGISLQDVTQSLSQRFSMPVGIYIVETVEGGPAQKAGLQSGDIITGFDDETITSYSDLENQLQYYAAGTTVPIRIERQENGEYVEYTIDVVLGTKDVITN